MCCETSFENFIKVYTRDATKMPENEQKMIKNRINTLNLPKIQECSY